MPREGILLAGDVGGTKTILSLHEITGGGHQRIASKTYLNSAYGSFDEVLDGFLVEADVVPQCASLAVAGPIDDGRVLMTNIDWTISSSEVAARLKVSRVYLTNDMVALAWALPALQESQLRALHSGSCLSADRAALIAPGTGCGEAFVLQSGREPLILSSEGGHADFAPSDALQLRLLNFLRREFRHVSVERVCSGIGIYNIYRFLRDAEGVPEEEWLSERIEGASDSTQMIGEVGVEGTSELCVRTLKLFASILASEAGNLALRYCATGGVYIGGGIPGRLISFIDTEEFRLAFAAKGRFQTMLQETPLRVITDDQAVLAGAARRGIAFMTAGPAGAQSEGSC